MVNEPTPRYIIKGSKCSFVKYGLDVQEVQQKINMNPTDPTFGIESIIEQGKLYFNNGSKIIAEDVITEKGNWAMLFQNLHDAIVHDEELLIKTEDVLEQIKIIESVIKK